MIKKQNINVFIKANLILKGSPRNIKEYRTVHFRFSSKAEKNKRGNKRAQKNFSSTATLLFIPTLLSCFSKTP